MNTEPDRLCSLLVTGPRSFTPRPLRDPQTVRRTQRKENTARPQLACRGTARKQQVGGRLMATAVIDREVAPRRWRLRLPERLPELKGAWLTAYSLLWMALLVIALVGSIGGAALLSARAADGAYPWAAFGLD